jgi:hypothetical protein
MKRRFSKFETDEGCKGFQEEPQANDVVVATSHHMDAASLSSNTIERKY